MPLFTGFAVYFLIWWITLFLVLPYGVRSQAEVNDVTPGTDPGAPVRPRLMLRLAVNTAIAGVVYALWHYATTKFGFDFRDLPSFFPQDR